MQMSAVSDIIDPWSLTAVAEIAILVPRSQPIVATMGHPWHILQPVPVY